MKTTTSFLIALAIIIGSIVIGRAYTYKYRAAQTIIVTGLGESEFESDLIVWQGTLRAESKDVAEGYARIERDKALVAEYIASKGIEHEEVVYQFVTTSKRHEDIYSTNGNYSGQKFVGYTLSQPITIESENVEGVEELSREISSLIAKGVMINAYAPSYYYSKLEDVKLTLIERASADARQRALKIAENAGAKLGSVASAKMGVFQITGANTNEGFSAGGSLNTSSKNKKARITMRVEYQIK
ncbi:MAG: SIMPL domain-containing protein [Rikenellaceae bacterium]